MISSSQSRLVLDWTKAHDVVPLEQHLAESTSALIQAKKTLLSEDENGHHMTGWLWFVEREGPTLLQSIQHSADIVANHSDAVVVIGIGGSLLGAKAVYEGLSHSFASLMETVGQRKPTLFWAGHNLATDELVELLDVLDQYSPTIIVISKSGSTTETALAFRILQNYLEDRFGQREAKARVIAITDSESGALNVLARQEGYKTFPIPRSIGGRYSVFTAVGLLPLAIAGIDINAFTQGAKQASQDHCSSKNENLETNPALCYAGLRNALYRSGYKMESLCTWTPKLKGLAEWWKQLFGESDGKSNTGLFPTSVSFTTDLHSLGQYFQEGERWFFATHIRVVDEYSWSKGAIKRKIKVPSQPSRPDGFEFLNCKDLSSIQSDAQQGTLLAHADGKVPSLMWELPELDPYWMGYWMQTNMIACAVGNYARGVNPFDQPGVEVYKTNMLALAGQPKMQEREAEIRARLQRGSRLRSLGLSSV